MEKEEVETALWGWVRTEGSGKQTRVCLWSVHGKDTPKAVSTLSSWIGASKYHLRLMDAWAL